MERLARSGQTAQHVGNEAMKAKANAAGQRAGAVEAAFAEASDGEGQRRREADDAGNLT